jgi:hypothetical protein
MNWFACVVLSEGPGQGLWMRTELDPHHRHVREGVEDGQREGYGCPPSRLAITVSGSPLKSRDFWTLPG